MKASEAKQLAREAKLPSVSSTTTFSHVLESVYLDILHRADRGDTWAIIRTGSYDRESVRKILTQDGYECTDSDCICCINVFWGN